MSLFQTVPVSQIRTDGLQVRCEVNRGHQDDLAELFDEENPVWPAKIPPVALFFDGKDYWLADGHHRLGAAIEAGCTEIKAEVCKGTRTDALWFALGSNADHGLKRTPADRRRAILLAHQLDPQLSNRKIAERCSVSEGLVRFYLAEEKKAAGCANYAPSQTEPPTATECANYAPQQTQSPTSAGCDNIAPQQSANPPRPSTPSEPRRPASKPAPIPEGVQPWTAAAVEFDEVIKLLREAQRRINTLAPRPGAELLRSNHLRCEKHGEQGERFHSPDIGNAMRELTHWKPVSVCLSCRETVRPGCGLCLGAGFLTQSALDRCPQRLKA